MPTLRIRCSDGRQVDFELPGDRPVSIGRAGSNDIALPDPALSRRHAELVPEGGRWILRDCGSRNGTFLDGRLLAGSRALRLGSSIRVGQCRLDFVDEDEDPSDRVALSDTPISDDALILPADAVSTMPDRLRVAQSEWEALRRRLQIIEQANVELLAHEPMEALLPKVLDLVFRAVRPERAALLLSDEEGNLVCRAFRGEKPAGEMEVSRSIARAVMTDRISMLVTDARADPRLGNSVVDRGIHAALAVPLRYGGEVFGMIYVDSRRDSGVFDEEDLRALSALANIAAIQIAVGRLIAEQHEKIRQGQELQAAAALQRRLLPEKAPEIPGYLVDGLNVPCHEVGGDYYDYVRLDDPRWAIVLADVAGKGLPAAMLLMGLRATFRAGLATRRQPDELLVQLNQVMLHSAPRNRFATLCLLQLDPATHWLRYLNAGHTPAPVLVRATGGSQRLVAGSLPLGVLPQLRPAAGRVQLAERDFVCMSSDGVTETVDPGGHHFGAERLDRLLVSLAGRPPQEVRQAVEEALDAHAQGARHPDDLTIVVVQRVA